MRNGKFPQLKFLELDELSLMKWIVADDAFPNPDQLVLHGCQDLVEIPSCFMDILSLKYIEVDNCNKYVVKSAKNIQETQVEDNQNTNFKLVIVKVYTLLRKALFCMILMNASFYIWIFHLVFLKNTVLKFDISHDKELNKAIKRLTSILEIESITIDKKGGKIKVTGDVDADEIHLAVEKQRKRDMR